MEQEEKTPKERVFEAALNSNDGARKIHRRLFGERGLPSERSVGSWIAEARGLPSGEKLAYEYATWPDTFTRELLPWSAAPLLAELERLYGPPSIAFVRHYMNAKASFPYVEDSEHLFIAGRLEDGDVPTLRNVWFNHYPSGRRAAEELAFPASSRGEWVADNE